MKKKFLKNLKIKFGHPNFGDILGNVSIKNGLDVVAGVEHVEVEAARGLGRPEAHRVDDIVAIARSWRIIRQGNYGLSITPLGRTLPSTIGVCHFSRLSATKKISKKYFLYLLCSIDCSIDMVTFLAVPGTLYEL